MRRGRGIGGAGGDIVAAALVGRADAVGGAGLRVDVDEDVPRRSGPIETAEAERDETRTRHQHRGNGL
ncbi:hypothetical protein GCM10025880_24850 [Methylorubrum aminovorans]|nr:hypothetical protein GCM10025880_24850 [Methylorubrum aminovorans]